MKTTLVSLGSILLCASLVQAQTNPGLDSRIQNSDPINSNRLDDARPLEQQNFFIDLGGGSQQFFRRGRDSLYFLPAENTKPILKIDETFGIQDTDSKKINNLDQDRKVK